MTPVATRFHRRAALVAAGLGSALALAGCGAEVAGTAATVGRLQAEQASQAQAQQAKVLEALKKAQEADARRVADQASAPE